MIVESNVPIAALTALLLSINVAAPAPAQTTEPYMARDIWPGATASNPHTFVVSSDRIYFNAIDGSHGHELWVSDGTRDGTRMVRDIEEGPASSHPSPTLGVNGTLFFERPSEDELWRSDGTEAGTVLVSSLPPVESSGRTAALGLLFMKQPSDDLGSEVWRSDGTAAGTFGLDLVPGSDGIDPSGLVAFDESLFFFSGDNSQILRTDGSVVGTQVVRDEVQMFNPFAHGGRLYFQGWELNMGGQELWISDGSTAGTHLLKDIRAQGSSFPSRFSPVGSLLFFFADDETHGEELWVTDGSTPGTVLVKDINPGPLFSTPTVGNLHWPSLGDRLIFSAQTEDLGDELWVSDGTEDGTQLLMDIFEGPGFSSPFYMTRFSDYVYFTAYTPDQGSELWRTDGTVEGTDMIDLRPGADSFAPVIIGATDSHIFLSGDDGVHGEELWAVALASIFSDGFESGDTSAWLEGP